MSHLLPRTLASDSSSGSCADGQGSTIDVALEPRAPSPAQQQQQPAAPPSPRMAAANDDFERRQRQAAEQAAYAADIARQQAALVAAQAECQMLGQQVVQLDAMARQPQSGAVQDWSRGERQKARSRQAALGC